MIVPIIVIIAVVFIAVAIVATILACCKVSGDCSRAEEQQDITEDL